MDPGSVKKILAPAPASAITKISTKRSNIYTKFIIFIVNYYGNFHSCHNHCKMNNWQSWNMEKVQLLEYLRCENGPYLMPAGGLIQPSLLCLKTARN